MGSETNSGNRKAAIVTGSATGVGAATALALAHRGYNVLINYSKSEAEARAVYQWLRRKGMSWAITPFFIPVTAASRAAVL